MPQLYYCILSLFNRSLATVPLLTELVVKHIVRNFHGKDLTNFLTMEYLVPVRTSFGLHRHSGKIGWTGWTS